MPSSKKSFSDLLDQPGNKPVIKRGPDFQLSTTAAREQEEPIAEAQNPADTEVRISGNTETRESGNNKDKRLEKPKRAKSGWEIRADLMRSIKHIGIDEGRPDYQIVEEALEEYIARYEARKRNRPTE